MSQSGVKNKIADALNRHIFVLTSMSIVVTGFKKLKTEYKSGVDSRDIYIKLKDGTTREVDGFVLYDGYLFLGRKLCIPRTSQIICCLELHADGLGGHFENKKTIEAVEYMFY